MAPIETIPNYSSSVTFRRVHLVVFLILTVASIAMANLGLVDLRQMKQSVRGNGRKLMNNKSVYHISNEPNLLSRTNNNERTRPLKRVKRKPKTVSFTSIITV